MDSVGVVLKKLPNGKYSVYVVTLDGNKVLTSEPTQRGENHPKSKALKEAELILLGISQKLQRGVYQFDVDGEEE